MKLRNCLRKKLYRKFWRSSPFTKALPASSIYLPKKIYSWGSARFSAATQQSKIIRDASEKFRIASKEALAVSSMARLAPATRPSHSRWLTAFTSTLWRAKDVFSRDDQNQLEPDLTKAGEVIFPNDPFWGKLHGLSCSPLSASEPPLVYGCSMIGGTQP